MLILFEIKASASLNEKIVKYFLNTRLATGPAIFAHRAKAIFGVERGLPDAALCLVFLSFLSSFTFSIDAHDVCFKTLVMIDFMKHGKSTLVAGHTSSCCLRFC